MNEITFSSCSAARRIFAACNLCTCMSVTAAAAAWHSLRDSFDALRSALCPALGIPEFVGLYCSFSFLSPNSRALFREMSLLGGICVLSLAGPSVLVAFLLSDERNVGRQRSFLSLFGLISEHTTRSVARFIKTYSEPDFACKG